MRAGVPAAVANATSFGGYINSQSYRARGAEVSFEAVLAREFRVMASYTRLDAEVTEAFSASTSFNPAFPGIAIGAFSPLVGERPFRRPTNSGTFSCHHQDPNRPEICIGTDAYHTPRAVLDLVVGLCEGVGWRVAVNRPFAGALVPMRHYHQDARVTAVSTQKPTFVMPSLRRWWARVICSGVIGVSDRRCWSTELTERPRR